MGDESKFNISADDGIHPTIITTQPDHILRHSISDEELDMLCDAKSDMVLEILLIAAGSAVGTLAATGAAIMKYFSASSDVPHNLGPVDFLQIIIFFGSLLVALSVGLIFKKKRGSSSTLRDQIRQRSKTD